jgi:hypothetical protein
VWVERGVRTVVTGLGGDEVTIDFDFAVDLARRNGVLGLPSTVSQVAELEQWPVRAATRHVLRLLTPARAHRVMWRARRRGHIAEHNTFLRRELWPVVYALEADAIPSPAPGFRSYTEAVRWGHLNAPVTQLNNAWWPRDHAAHGVRIASPLHDRRILELVLGTSPERRPRSYDRGEYKPLITQALGPMMPAALTRGYWKVHFRDLHRQVLRENLASLREYLLDATDWRSSQFVPRESAQRLLERVRQNLSDPSSSIKTENTVAQILGLEVWLRSRYDRPGTSTRSALQ